KGAVVIAWEQARSGCATVGSAARCGCWVTRWRDTLWGPVAGTRIGRAPAVRAVARRWAAEELGGENVEVGGD
uniref:hypothetical protein n=1 Tax=Salmonella enterica TaxID=28901 RepID=UPI00398C2F9F